MYTAMILDENTMIAEGNERTSLPAEIPISLIAPAAKATLEVIDFLDKKNEKDLIALKKLLDEEWVQPNQFREWEDI